MTDEEQVMMVRILFTLNCGKKMTRSDIAASLACTPESLDSPLSFLRNKLFVIPELIPGSQTITHRIGKRGIGILNMLDIWFKAKL